MPRSIMAACAALLTLVWLHLLLTSVMTGWP